MAITSIPLSSASRENSSSSRGPNCSADALYPMRTPGSVVLILAGRLSLALARRKCDRHRRQGVGPVRLEPLGVPGEFDVLHTAQDLLEGDSELQAGEAGAEAEVAAAAAEGLVVDLLAGDVEAMRVLGDRRIPRAGLVPDHHLVA